MWTNKTKLCEVYKRTNGNEFVSAQMCCFFCWQVCVSIDLFVQLKKKKLRKIKFIRLKHDISQEFKKEILKQLNKNKEKKENIWFINNLYGQCGQKYLQINIILIENEKKIQITTKGTTYLQRLKKNGQWTHFTQDMLIQEEV